MARAIDSTAPRGADLAGRLDLFLAELGQGFNAYLLARSRAAEAERLDALTDRQLAEQGLRREDIPRHVFRDLIEA